MIIILYMAQANFKAIKSDVFVTEIDENCHVR